MSSATEERKRSFEDKNREFAKLSEVGFRILSLINHYVCDIRVNQMQTTKKLSQERHKETSQLERGLVSARGELLSTRRQVMWTQKDTKTKEMAHLI